MTLNGTKSNATDMHSITAKAVGISRDHAKGEAHQLTRESPPLKIPKYFLLPNFQSVCIYVDLVGHTPHSKDLIISFLLFSFELRSNLRRRSGVRHTITETVQSDNIRR